jgi:glycosyltransferase involved in cell wall biosynthesis
VSSIAVIAPDPDRNAFYTPWQFAGALRKRHAVTIVGPGTAETLWSPARALASQIRFLPDRRSSRVQIRRTLLNEIKACDLLYAFGATPYALGLALWVRKEIGTPVAVHLDDWNGGYFSDKSILRRTWYVIRAPLDPSNEALQRYWEARTAAADLISVSSRPLQSRFGGHVVRQGVDTDRYSPATYTRTEARLRLRIQRTEKLVLFLGSPARHKGIEDLVATFRARRAPDTQLWIIGQSQDDVFQHELEALAGEGIVIGPSVSMEEAGWFIAASDVFVVPQRPTPYAIHQTPAKLLQAMAHGAGIVGCDVGDIREILAGGNAEDSGTAGIVVRPSDGDALWGGVDRLLRDAALRERVGQNARERAVQHYGWEAMSRHLDDMLHEFVRPHRKQTWTQPLAAP